MGGSKEEIFLEPILLVELTNNTKGAMIGSWQVGFYFAEIKSSVKKLWDMKRQGGTQTISIIQGTGESCDWEVKPLK